MTEKQKWIWTILIVFLAVAGIALAVQAIENDEDKDGVSYGSDEVDVRDTAYVNWWSQTYLDLQPYAVRNNISFNFKATTFPADTVILSLLGSNFYKDSTRFYYEIAADTMITGSLGDSSAFLGVPFGSTALTQILPRFLKVRIILAAADSNCVAAIASGVYGQ